MSEDRAEGKHVIVTEQLRIVLPIIPTGMKIFLSFSIPNICDFFNSISNVFNAFIIQPSFSFTGKNSNGLP